MPKTSAPAGHDWFAFRVSDDIKEFVTNEGGTKMVRRLITARYIKREQELPPKGLKPVYDEPPGLYHKDCKSITVRVNKALHDFVIAMGGAPYMRSLLRDHMKLKEVSNGQVK